MPEPVFVQPHYDDVALSCGGTVAALAAREEVRIVTIFGGDPGAGAGAFARFQHARWKLEDPDVIAARREEDRRAAGELGAGVLTVWLDYLDAIYRDDAYASDEALFGDPVDSDSGLVEKVAEELHQHGEMFVMPLAVGHHVDHQLAFLAASRLHAAGKEVWLYADLPYALDERGLHSRLAELNCPAPCVRALAAEHFERRWRAIECYASQLPVILRDVPDARNRFERFGATDRHSSPLELFWNISAIEGQGS